MYIVHSMTTTETQLIRLGHSPDPDDAFMFYALAEDRIPSDGFKIEHVIEDIESLNQRALKREIEVTAVSCHAYAYLADTYIPMRAGSSIGYKYGPILVAPAGQKFDAVSAETFKGKKIAIPGKLTTAYLLLQLFQKDITPVFIQFDEIFEAVKQGKADFGLVIHEGQLTFADHGFQKCVDLGQWWFDQTGGLPLPLGVDCVRRDLGEDTVIRFAKLFKSSIQYALDHREPALRFAQQYGRGISDELNDKFCGMYVNDFTVDMGDQGKAGFQKLMDWGFEAGIIPKRVQLEFVEI